MQIGYCGDTKKRCVGVTAQLGSLKIRGNQSSKWVDKGHFRKRIRTRAESTRNVVRMM